MSRGMSRVRGVVVEYCESEKPLSKRPSKVVVENSNLMMNEI